MPFWTENFDKISPFFLMCEHATNVIPDEYNNLGMSDEDLQQHYALDIGAADITVRLSEKLQAPAILGSYSRLLIDINRGLNYPTLFVSEGEGRKIPGNLDMSPEQRQQRIKKYYEPYHKAVDAKIEEILSQSRIPLSTSIHTFTPRYFRQKRVWDIGFLWTQDDRSTKFMCKFFEDRGFCVGNNEPYNAQMMRGTTMNQHVDSRRLPNTLVEIRNDLSDTPEKNEEWAELLAQAFTALAEHSEMFTPYEGPEVPYDPVEGQRYFDRIIHEAKMAQSIGE